MRRIRLKASALPSMTADGIIYTGCNIENAALSPGLCAERVAMAKAISAGERLFIAIAICGGPLDAPAAPGGAVFIPVRVAGRCWRSFAAAR